MCVKLASWQGRWWWWDKILGQNSVAKRHQTKYRCQAGTGFHPVGSFPFLLIQGDGNDETFLKK